MKCASRGCNGEAGRRYPWSRWCDDCYEEIVLRLPDPPPIRERIKAWWRR